MKLTTTECMAMCMHSNSGMTAWLSADITHSMGGVLSALHKIFKVQTDLNLVNHVPRRRIWALKDDVWVSFVVSETAKFLYAAAWKKSVTVVCAALTSAHEPIWTGCMVIHSVCVFSYAYLTI